MNVPAIQRIFDHHTSPRRSPTNAAPMRTILIIEDDQALSHSMCALLASAERSFIMATSIAQAIERLKTATFDLILLDYHLPDATGLALMEWLKQESRAEAVIMISGEESIETAIAALRAGVDDFLRKPYHPDQLRRAVTNSLQKIILERSNRRMRAELEESERLHRYLVEHSLDLIYTLTPDGHISYLNTRIESLLGYRRDELIGQNYQALLWKDDYDRVKHIFCERRTGKRASANIELRLMCNPNNQDSESGAYITVELNAMGMYNTPHRKSATDFLGTYGVARDISERIRAEETIVFQAYHDQLTQLPNRMLFKDRLDVAIAQAQRKKALVGVIFIDLDRFKIVNDTFGHAEGDDLLRSVARRITRCLRQGDTLARQGSDEFAVLLPDIQTKKDAEVIAIKILEELKQPFAVAYTEFRTTASIGIALFPENGTNAEELCKHADMAMFQIKTRGKNNYSFFDPLLHHVQSQRMSLEKELIGAVEKNELHLEYQLKYSISQKHFTGVEALVRWHHPNFGLVNPTEFISVAEECGLIQNISLWVMDAACAQLARWREEGYDKLRLAFNLSPKDFDREDIIELIIATAQRHSIPLNLLDIEITENVLLQDVDSVASKLRELRKRAINVSIDDFGTGYSSLAYLHKFPVSCLKIDRSFVRELNKQNRNTPIISAIHGVAKGFNLHIVAEGVETEEQVNALRNLGCDEMQGFYFSKPLPAIHVSDKLERQRNHPSGFFSRL